ncbi:MAG: 4-(cytidine 5'-diphospho)-2-C-methyl-D-erythritol kinase [Pseudomonadota bacterium]
MIERIAHAKINLALHVTGQRKDGYHLLDSLVVFSEYGDKVRVDKPHHAHGPLEVSVDGPFSQGLSGGPGNLVSSAALMLMEAVKKNQEVKPVAVHLTKNLPVASGIGGGSADAAATLLALQEFWGSDVDLVPIAAGLGADVPMCLQSKPLRAEGIGDKLSPLKTENALSVLLVNPGQDVPTPIIFRLLKDKENSPISSNGMDTLPDLTELGAMRNDLQGPAEKLFPVISDVLERLVQAGAVVTRMSGSGATCFGIFNTLEEAEAAGRAILKENSDWWCVAAGTTVG